MIGPSFVHKYYELMSTWVYHKGSYEAIYLVGYKPVCLMSADL
jgi:hypothetical protein